MVVGQFTRMAHVSSRSFKEEHEVMRLGSQRQSSNILQVSSRCSQLFYVEPSLWPSSALKAYRARSLQKNSLVAWLSGSKHSSLKRVDFWPGSHNINHGDVRHL